MLHCNIAVGNIAILLLGIRLIQYYCAVDLSCCRLARNLFRVFRMRTNKKRDETDDSTSHETAGESTQRHADSHILGRYVGDISY